jgi:hypothetical protein
MAKRGSRKRRRSLGARLILIIALILMIAGFLTRRMLIPTQRGLPRTHPDRYGAGAAPSSNEQLNDRDRAELDAIIRNKTRTR